MSTDADAAGLAELNAAAEQLWLAAQSRWPALSIEVLPEVDSTNSHAMAMGRQGLSDPAVVVAWRQTAGRGRAGRVWQAEPGQTLTLSVALPLDLTHVPGGGSALSLAVGTVVAEVMEALGAPAQLKWPNDLWIQDRKLGGILIEASHSTALPPDQRWVVIGLGLNLWGTPAEWRSERCDLHEWGVHGDAPGSPPQPGQLMRALVPALLEGAQLFERSGFATFMARYARRDALLGRAVNLWRHQAPPATLQAALHPSPEASGTAAGVDAQGALLIHDAHGRPQPWRLGEVSVRPIPDHL